MKIVIVKEITTLPYPTRFWKTPTRHSLIGAAKSPSHGCCTKSGADVEVASDDEKHAMMHNDANATGNHDMLDQSNVPLQSKQEEEMWDTLPAPVPEAAPQLVGPVWICHGHSFLTKLMIFSSSGFGDRIKKS